MVYTKFLTVGFCHRLHPPEQVLSCRHPGNEAYLKIVLQSLFWINREANQMIK